MAGACAPPARWARAFADRPAFRRPAALLRRVRQRPEPTPFVGTHAQHLLCNKLGYSLRAEAAFTQALCTLPASS